MKHRILAAARRLTHRVWSWRIARATARPDRQRILGVDLVVLPGVLHPAHFESSRLLGRHLQTLPLAGLRVADLGTGSGFLGLIAARGGATVTAVDINPRAVACAEANVTRNGLLNRMTVRLSDVFDQVPSEESFDLIVTNPPFYPRAAGNSADLAFAAGPDHGFISRLADALNGRLVEGGTLLMIHSSDTDFSPVEAHFARRGLNATTVSRHRRLFESLTIRAFRAAPDHSNTRV